MEQPASFRTRVQHWPKCCLPNCSKGRPGWLALSSRPAPLGRGRQPFIEFATNFPTLCRVISNRGDPSGQCVLSHKLPPLDSQVFGYVLCNPVQGAKLKCNFALDHPILSGESLTSTSMRTREMRSCVNASVTSLS